MSSKGLESLDGKGTILERLLGADGVGELRSEIIKVIVEEVREQLAGSSNYIISPEDICDELYKEVIAQVKESVIEEYTNIVSLSMKNRFAEVLNDINRQN